MTLKQIEKALKGKSVNKVLKTLCEQKPLGQGIHRVVFPIKGTKRYVLKFELHPDKGSFSNACEFRNYINNRYYKWLSKFMAPCHAINETGQIMIQSRTKPGNRKDYPKTIPAYFSDTKIENFGWLNGKFVCHDYAYLILGPPTMKKAKWWTINGNG